MKDIKHKIYAMAKDDLEGVEAALKNHLNPQIDLVSKIAGHILFSGGKRLRPLLMILSSKLCGYQGNDHIVFSTVFEYLHAATLLHDDLIDLSSTRRGKPAAHIIWGNPETILTGDFLLARAILIAAETNNIRLTKIVAHIAEKMSLGEISQLMNSRKTDISEKQYMDIISWKTAVLFQCACQAGAIIADAPEKNIEALSEYGFNLGIAFQMTDDLLDYTSETKTLGKNIGADLKEGKITLPLIYALKHACLEDRLLMETIITTKAFTQDNFHALIELIEKYNGFSYTSHQAAGHITAAKQALLSFKDSETKDLFLNIADYALLRDV
jgi:octaprenyl-diphosphate synthase